MNNPDANATAGIPAAGGGGMVPSFLDDPATCLNTIANRPPSRELWAMLSGPAASFMKEDASAPYRSLYLQAVAQQLPASDIMPSSSSSAAAAAAAAAGMGMGMDAVAAAAAGVGVGTNNSSVVEFEMIRAQRLFEVLDAASLAATRVTPRLAITQSGILRALLVQPGFKSPVLTQVQVEFCQMALLAEQYRFAARVMQGSWPRPTDTLSVRHVLRYFLYRGMIHIGCNDFNMAVRCFWTCLSVPAEVVSALSISAWKKLVLVQCLQMEDDDYRAAQEFQLKQLNQQRQAIQQQSMSIEAMMIEETYGRGGVGGTGGGVGGVISTTTTTSSAAQYSSASAPNANGRGPMSLPKAVPNCITRFLSMASNDKRQQQQQQQQRSQQQQIGAPEEAGHHMVQEELGEPSGQQQHQQQQPQQQQQQRGYSAMGVRIYMELVYAFVAGDSAQFRSLLDQHINLFQTDGNLGLVRQCETAMLHRQVYQISRMFSVISLTNLATKLKMESVEALKELLQQLSLQKSCKQGGGVDAAALRHSKWPDIEVEQDGMVVFSFEENSTTTAPPPDVFSGIFDEEGGGAAASGGSSNLETSMEDLINLTQMVEKLDVSIATSPMYHALVRRANDAKMGGPRGVEEL